MRNNEVLLDPQETTVCAQSQLCEWAVRAQSCRAIRASCSRVGWAQGGNRGERGSLCRPMDTA